jgi:hypothetical protein
VRIGVRVAVHIELCTGEPGRGVEAEGELVVRQGLDEGRGL